MGIFTKFLMYALKNTKAFYQVAKALNIDKAQKLYKALTTNPKVVGEWLSKLKPKQIDNLNRIINNKINSLKTPLKSKINIETKQSTQSTNIKNPLQVSKDKSWIKELPKEDEAILYSSWLVYGKIERDTTRTVGDLTLETKQGKQYTWFSVPNKVWELMKVQRGRDGTGAGQIFWDYYLRGVRHSRLRIGLSTAFKRTGIKLKISSKETKNLFKNKYKTKK